MDKTELCSALNYVGRRVTCKSIERSIMYCSIAFVMNLGTSWQKDRYTSRFRMPVSLMYLY